MNPKNTATTLKNIFFIPYSSLLFLVLRKINVLTDATPKPINKYVAGGIGTTLPFNPTVVGFGEFGDEGRVPGCGIPFFTCAETSNESTNILIAKTTFLIFFIDFFILLIQFF